MPNVVYSQNPDGTTKMSVVGLPGESNAAAGVSAFSSVSPYQSYLTNGASDISSLTSGVNSLTGGLTSGVSSSVNSVVGTATNYVPGAINTVEGYASTVINGVTSLFNAGEHAVASLVDDVFHPSSLFGDSNSKTQSAINTLTPDAFGSSFKGGTPQSMMFTTSPINSSLTGLSLSGQSSTSTLGMFEPITGLQQTLSNRFGLSSLVGTIGSDIHSAVSAVTQNSLISGLYSGISTAVSVAGQVVSTAQSVGAAESSVGTVEGVVDGATDEYHNLVGGMALQLTGSATGLDSFFDSSLPGLATVTGGSLTGYNSSTPLGFVNGLINGASSSLGCTIGGPSAYATAYAATQSALAALLSMCAGAGLTSLLQQLFGCSSYGSYGQSVSQNLFMNYAGSNAATASTLMTGLAPGQITPSVSLNQSIVTNPNLTPSDVGYVQNIFTGLGVTDTSSVYQSAQTLNGQDVWDESVLSQSPYEISSVLTNNSSASQLVGGQSLDLSSDMMVGGLY